MSDFRDQIYTRLDRLAQKRYFHAFQIDQPSSRPSLIDKKKKHTSRHSDKQIALNQ